MLFKLKTTDIYTNLVELITKIGEDNKITAAFNEQGKQYLRKLY